MRMIYFGVLLLALVNSVNAQDFCGVIKYRYTYYKGEKEVTAIAKGNKTEEFYICGNRFKTIFDGRLSEIMIGDSSAYFFAVSDSTMGYVKANATYGQKLPKYSAVRNCVFRGEEYECLDEKLKGETITYYFRREIGIETNQFRQINLYHWDKFFEATNGALRLISVSKKGRWLRVSEAVEVIRMSPEQIDFSIPTGFEIEERKGFKVYN